MTHLLTLASHALLKCLPTLKRLWKLVENAVENVLIEVKACVWWTSFHPNHPSACSVHDHLEITERLHFVHERVWIWSTNLHDGENFRKKEAPSCLASSSGHYYISQADKGTVHPQVMHMTPIHQLMSHEIFVINPSIRHYCFQLKFKSVHNISFSNGKVVLFERNLHGFTNENHSKQI